MPPPRRQLPKSDPWGPRYSPPDSTSDVEIFPDFSETVTHALDDTMRNLVVLREEEDEGRPRKHREDSRHRSEEDRGLELQVLQNLTNEVKELRSAIAGVITTVNLKASKRALSDAEKALAKQVTDRLDTIRNWTGAVIAVVTVVLTILKVRG